MHRRFDTDFFTPPAPRVFAHRGFSSAWPENTLASFLAAERLGTAYAELDVRLTRDGKLVVSHDAEMTRASGRAGAIAELTFDQLSAFDAACNFTADDGSTFPLRGRGIRVPLLSEVLETCRALRILIEIKPEDPRLVPEMLRVIEAAGASRRVLVASEHQRPIDAVRALAPAIPTNLPPAEIGDFLQAMARGMRDYLPKGDALQVTPEYEGWKLVTQESVAAAHGAGIEVHVWTIDDAAEMRAMLDLGVDGIITNFPDRLLKIIS